MKMWKFTVHSDQNVKSFLTESPNHLSVEFSITAKLYLKSYLILILPFGSKLLT